MRICSTDWAWTWETCLVLSRAKTRSISPENTDGGKGRGGMAMEGTGAHNARHLGQGWKISPSFDIEAGETLTMADIEGFRGHSAYLADAHRPLALRHPADLLG